MTFSVLGIDVQTGHRIEIPQASRRQGLYIIGSPGMGKTGLIENLIIQDIQQGIGVCLLDPHGDVTHAVLSRIPDKEREEKVILLDIADENFPFGLNLFACNNPQSAKAVQYVVDQVMHIFDKLFDVDRATPLITEYLRNCTHTLVVNPGSTMADIPLLLLDEQCRKKLVAQVTDPDVRLFWRVYEQMKPGEQREEAASTLRRVREFLQPLTRNIVGQSKTTINVRSVMDERKILLVKLDARLQSVTSLIGSVIVAEFLNAAYSRSDVQDIKKRKQFNIYADEFQRFATEDFATLLTEARKFGIATTIAHQMREQLDPQNRGATLNVANVVVFKISGKDADELAGEFDSTPPPPEIIGWRPILTPKNDVIDHLQKQGHTHPAVNAFANTYLIPAIRVVEQNKKAYYFAMKVSAHPGGPKQKLLIADLDEAIQQLNIFLFSVMGEKNAEKPIPPLIFWMFAKLYGFSDGFASYMTLSNPLSGNPLPSIFHPKDELFFICAPDFPTYRDQIAQKISPYTLPAALTFVTHLRHVMNVLAIDPILVNTGQHEPIYDKPRTYADVQNEIATRLANLPKFTARVKIMGTGDNPVEHIIKMLEPERGYRGVALQDRIDRIGIQNRRDGYVRERAQIEEEIRLRQEAYSQPTRKKSHQGDEEVS